MLKTAGKINPPGFPKGVELMNKHERDFLKANWEQMQKKLQYSLSAEELDVSDGCYVTFGTVGISVFKYRNKRWLRKTVNGWKKLTFVEFMAKLEQGEWESV